MKMDVLRKFGQSLEWNNSDVDTYPRIGETTSCDFAVKDASTCTAIIKKEKSDRGAAESGPFKAVSIWRKHKFLIGATLAASVGSSAQFGYAIGMLNIIRPVIISEFQENTTCSPDFDANELASKSSRFFFELSTAMLCAGGLISALVAGPLADRFGRKTVLLLNNIVSIIGGLIMGLASSYPLLIVGRAFQGFAAGVGLVVVSVFLAEISPRSLRGAVGATTHVWTATGILLATVLGLPSLLGNCELWNVVVGGPVLLAVVQLVSLPFVPESPVYLYITRGEVNAAREALHRLRGPGVCIEDEMAELEREKERQADAKATPFLQDIRDRQLRSRFIITAVLMLSRQLSCINCVFFYSSVIYSSAGLTNVAVVALVPAVVDIPVSIASSQIVERLGRRKLMLIGMAGLLVSHLLLTAGFGFSDLYFHGKKGANWTAALTITGSLGVVVSFSLGPGPLSWLLVSELFPLKSRANGFIVGGVVNWVMNYLVGQFFVDILFGLNPYGFLVFAGLAGLFLSVVFFLLPETKGKRFEEIDDFFRHNATNAFGCSLFLGREVIGQTEVAL